MKTARGAIKARSFEKKRFKPSWFRRTQAAELVHPPTPRHGPARLVAPEHTVLTGGWGFNPSVKVIVGKARSVPVIKQPRSMKPRLVKKGSR